ncbi:MAG: hypothetical protein JRI77_00905 [Deltaproteobacteria bacterium]|nr:hypothetical protein [Deltaproteobacteria bacterium]
MTPISLRHAIQSLPMLEDDPYLRMQALNLDVVDNLLEQMESQLLDESMETERTPLPTAAIVSALSQLWIFGVYELLRTWRQRVIEVLCFSDEIISSDQREKLQRLAEQKEKIRKSSACPERSEPSPARALERVVSEPQFAENLRNALHRSEQPFRQIEALRINLAKHEMPKKKGSFSLAPGYGRIDMTTGSICWQVSLKNNEVDNVSRRDVADSCRELSLETPVVVLPDAVQRKVERFNKQRSYGVKQVTLILDDGTEYPALIGWNKKILSVGGTRGCPFDPSQGLAMYDMMLRSREPYNDSLQRMGATAKLIVPAADLNC